MQSAVAVTYELDDALLAAQELSASVYGQLTLGKESVGILYCEADMDHSALLRELEKKLPIPFIGCTTAAALDDGEGFREFCVTLAVLTGDDCKFAVSCTEPLTPENAPALLEEAYKKAISALGETPRLAYALTRGLPGMMNDIYPEVLTKASDGVPVFGGVPSGGTVDYRAVLFDGESYDDRMVLLLVGGGVKPIFNCLSIRPDTILQKRAITKAKDNIIYEVGGVSMKEYMESIDMALAVSGDADRTHSFLSKPLYIDDVERGVSFVRVIIEIDDETGSAVTNGKMVEGNLLSIGVLRKQEIEESAAICIHGMLEKIKENETGGYRYSMILCTTCIGRYMILAPFQRAEGDIIRDAVGQQIRFAGFYSWGELCPLEGRDGGLVNTAHDETISMCAI